MILKLVLYNNFHITCLLRTLLFYLAILAHPIVFYILTNIFLSLLHALVLALVTILVTLLVIIDASLHVFQNMVSMINLF